MNVHRAYTEHASCFMNLALHFSYKRTQSYYNECDNMCICTHRIPIKLPIKYYEFSYEYIVKFNLY